MHKYSTVGTFDFDCSKFNLEWCTWPWPHNLHNTVLTTERNNYSSKFNWDLHE